MTSCSWRKPKLLNMETLESLFHCQQQWAVALHQWSCITLALQGHVEVYSYPLSLSVQSNWLEDPAFTFLLALLPPDCSGRPFSGLMGQETLHLERDHLSKEESLGFLQINSTGRIPPCSLPFEMSYSCSCPKGSLQQHLFYGNPSPHSQAVRHELHDSFIHLAFNGVLNSSCWAGLYSHVLPRSLHCLLLLLHPLQLVCFTPQLVDANAIASSFLLSLVIRVNDTEQISN